MLQTLHAIKNLAGKKVLLRADFNVPIGKNRKVDSDEDWRIRATLPTIKFLQKKKAETIIISHLGRPGGKYRAEMSLKPVAEYLNSALKMNVKFEGGKIFAGPTLSAIQKMKKGDIVLLENLRFNIGEERNNEIFAATLAGLGDIYVNDAFAVSHRNCASVSAITEFLPSYAGPLLENEIKHLDKIRKPARPIVLLVGGAKTDTKLPLIEFFLKKADYILAGGGVANTAFKCKGFKIGGSLGGECAYDMKRILLSKKVRLPVDVIVGDERGKKARAVPINVNGKFAVKKGEEIFDIGPATVNLYSEIIRSAKTVVWNGAMGFFENPHYSFGTNAMARVVAVHGKGRAFAAVGGGETVQSLQRVKMFDFVDHVSTGGGAMLDYLVSGTLPGIDALIESQKKKTLKKKHAFKFL